jgi:hypothetical protein
MVTIMEDFRMQATATAQALRKLADAIEGRESQTHRLAAAYDIFGKSGRDFMEAIAKWEAQTQRNSDLI